MNGHRNNPRGGGGRDRQQPEYPKPYDFVPLPLEQKPDVVSGHHIYHKGHLSGKLTGQMVARSPVHVASGLLEKSSGKYPLVKAHFRSRDTPTIPGSSLKGCIRSIVEAITHSSIQIVTRRIPIPSEMQSRMVKSGKSPQQNKLDPAQRIFGAMGYQGLVNFRDAVLHEGETTPVPAPQLFRPRTEAMGKYFVNRQLLGRKFYMHGELAEGNMPLEACAVGSVFHLQMDFENLKQEELGVVLLALGLGEQSFCPKLGGGKPACLGTIAVQNVVLDVWDAHAAYDDFATPPLGYEVATLIQQARESDLVLQEQLDKVAEILRYPREDKRVCPKGTY